MRARLSLFICSLATFCAVGLGAARLAAAETALERVRASGELRIAVDVPYGKMEFYDADGSLQGVDIDIARHVARHLGVEPKFEVMPFAELFDAIDERRADVVISAVTITAERQQKMRFSVPYFDAALQIAVRKGDASIASLNDLSSKRIGVLKGTVGETFALKSEYLDRNRIAVFESNDVRLKALLEKEIDAIIMHFSLKNHPTLRTLGKPLSQSYYGVVGHLEDETLIDAVNRALRDLQTRGELDKIKEAHLN
ncbi:MAG: ABC transporter substrate-binding protein [Pseudomonadota bacterium]